MFCVLAKLRKKTDNVSKIYNKNIKFLFSELLYKINICTHAIWDKHSTCVCAIASMLIVEQTLMSYFLP